MTRLEIRCSKEQKEKFEIYCKQLGFKTNAVFLEASIDALYSINYMNKHESILNDHIIRGMEATVKASEQRLGNRFAKLMSEMAIQLAITQTIQKTNNHLTDIEIEQIRVDVVRMLEASQSVLKYNHT